MNMGMGEQMMSKPKKPKMMKVGKPKRMKLPKFGAHSAHGSGVFTTEELYRGFKTIK